MTAAAAAAAASPSSHCVPTDADGRRRLKEELEQPLETAAMLCVQTSYALILFCYFESSCARETERKEKKCKSRTGKKYALGQRPLSASSAAAPAAAAPGAVGPGDEQPGLAHLRVLGPERG